MGFQKFATRPNPDFVVQCIAQIRQEALEITRENDKNNETQNFGVNLGDALKNAAAARQDVGSSGNNSARSGHSKEGHHGKKRRKTAGPNQLQKQLQKLQSDENNRQNIQTGPLDDKSFTE